MADKVDYRILQDGIMTPFGPTGKKVELYKFQPIKIIPIWNAWSLLWTYVHRPSRRASKKDVRGKNILYNEKPAGPCPGRINKSCIAKFIGFKVLDTDPKELTYYITCVAEYGFDHIIIVGETTYGMIFLEAQKYAPFGDKLAWFVENGVVREYIRKSHYVLYILKRKWK
ncbi:hypothetical protein RhiirC2_776796 [Rhizophagus irregularis]|uniref:Uncharacterized protein n=1 Tax=Rhizophagus irregularis TaxID=588596 RepID=A0A2N1NFX9_9GLOM|nr:hypothetical protein RhiirC2_776796 [Rhizophagus irregularis]